MPECIFAIIDVLERSHVAVNPKIIRTALAECFYGFEGGMVARAWQSYERTFSGTKLDHNGCQECLDAVRNRVAYLRKEKISHGEDPNTVDVLSDSIFKNVSAFMLRKAGPEALADFFEEAIASLDDAADLLCQSLRPVDEVFPSLEIEMAYEVARKCKGKNPSAYLRIRRNLLDRGAYDQYALQYLQRLGYEPEATDNETTELLGLLDKVPHRLIVFETLGNIGNRNAGKALAQGLRKGIESEAERATVLRKRGEYFYWPGPIDQQALMPRICHPILNDFSREEYYNLRRVEAVWNYLLRFQDQLTGEDILAFANPLLVVLSFEEDVYWDSQFQSMPQSYQSRFIAAQIMALNLISKTGEAAFVPILADKAYSVSYYQIQIAALRGLNNALKRLGAKEVRRSLSSFHKVCDIHFNLLRWQLRENRAKAQKEGGLSPQESIELDNTLLKIHGLLKPRQLAQHPKKRAVVLGSGAIVRGALAPALIRQGYFPSLVYWSSKVRSLYERDAVETKPARRFVSRFEALSRFARGSIVEAFEEAEVVFVSVGLNHIKNWLEMLKACLKARAVAQPTKPINIVFCENFPLVEDPLQEIRQELLRDAEPQTINYIQQHVGLSTGIYSETSVYPSRAESAASPNLARIQRGLFPIAIDGKPLKTPLNLGEEFEVVDDIDFMRRRKLYIHNCGHAVCGYLGWQRGFCFIHEAIADPEVRSLTTDAMLKSASFVAEKAGLAPFSLHPYVHHLVDLFSQEEPADSIERVIQDPERKLAPRDRLLGPAVGLYDRGIVSEGLILAILAAFDYLVTVSIHNYFASSDKIVKALKEHSPHIPKVMEMYSYSSAIEKILRGKIPQPLFDLLYKRLIS